MIDNNPRYYQMILDYVQKDYSLPNDFLYAIATNMHADGEIDYDVVNGDAGDWEREVLDAIEDNYSKLQFHHEI